MISVWKRIFVLLHQLVYGVDPRAVDCDGVVEMHGPDKQSNVDHKKDSIRLSPLPSAGNLHTAKVLKPSRSASGSSAGSDRLVNDGWIGSEGYS